MAPTAPRESPIRTWLSTIPILLLLLAVLAHGTGEKLNARLLEIGQRTWPGYARLRVDPEKPTCDPNAMPGAARAAAASAPASAPGGAASAPASAAAAKPHDAIDDLLGEETVNVEAAKQAAAAARQRCIDAHAAYQTAIKRLTGGLRAFRVVEKGTSALVDFAVTYLQHILVLMLLLSAFTTTAIRSHISLRNPRSRLDYLFADGSMVLANIFLTASSIAQILVDRAAGVTVQHAELPFIWAAGFAVLTVLSLRNLIRRPASATPGGSLGHALLAAPPFAGMAIATGTYFLLREGHPSGLAIYMQKLAEHALLYLQVGLYVWVGMILARTRLAAMAFDVLRPWRLPPEVLAAIVVAFAAFPTAYSGASGIFVMAAGPMLFAEMRRAGARPQLAIATTAMSGSLGVSIQPCLLVVIIAALNKEVTTDQVYAWGWRVYALAAAGILVAALAIRWRSLKDMAPPSEAAPASGRTLLALVPYFVIGGLVVAFYTFGLGTKVNEHTAPTVLPILLILLLMYDTRAARRAAAALPAAPGAAPRGTGRLLFEATAETSSHIGALLMLMGSSMCLGGIIERSNFMALIGTNLGSPIVAMAILVVLKVLIGMFMDPYGAVILVSVTLAPVAYKSGIDPVHFWAMVLVSFELGYLTPPIGLNTLLSRRIVEQVEPDLLVPQEGRSFWARHEGVILNCGIMTVVLLLVAFLPFLWKYPK